MPKSKLALLIGALALIIGLVFVFKRQKSEPSATKSQTSTNHPLSVNAIPVSQRPFVTLTPDIPGRNLTFTLDKSPLKTLVEYELVYTAGDKQEGAFGRINLSQETQPVSKKILLGSKSAGGSITYHEGVTGGSLTLIYDQTKLKEDFNFLRFDPTNSDGYSSVDARFTAYFTPKQLNRNSVVLIMKSFGLPAKPPAGKIAAGPYYVGTAKGLAPAKIELRLSAANPTLYQYQKGEWIKLDANYTNGLLTATPNDSHLFLVTE